MGILIPTFFLSHSQSVTENLRKNVKIIWMSLYGVKLLKLEEIMPDNKFLFIYFLLHLVFQKRISTKSLSKLYKKVWVQVKDKARLNG